MVEIQIEWVLAALMGAGGVISTLATIMWKMTQDRLKKQDLIIENLQKDISRLSQGCGMTTCLWKRR